MSHAYRLSNLKVLSDIELPELMPWTGASDMSDEVFFRVGEIPAGQSSAGPAAGGSELPDGHRCLLTLGDKGKVLVENGREVIIEPAEGADPTDTRAVIMGPIQAVMWHQRGLVPLHASAISMNGRAVALAGPSGVGKSTLAAAFSTRGYAVLSDDICIVDTRNGATVLPSTPRLRLWRQALDHFGFPPDGLPRALSRSEKYLIEGNWAGAEQQQLAAVILLSRGAYREVTIRRVRGRSAFSSLQDVVHMFGIARSLGFDAAIFTALGQMFDAGATVWELSVPEDLAYLEQAVEKVSEVARSHADLP
jgi:hypothetical protein